ncbi:MAG: hypothetical protein ABI895_08905, partial [Deltaproteobacteria bacterium]
AGLRRGHLDRRRVQIGQVVSRSRVSSLIAVQLHALDAKAMRRDPQVASLVGLIAVQEAPGVQRAKSK